jgi:hypothetical protein
MFTAFEIEFSGITMIFDLLVIISFTICIIWLIYVLSNLIHYGLLYITNTTKEIDIITPISFPSQW